MSDGYVTMRFMKIRNGQRVYSPSDLIVFMESPFASWMDRLRLEDPEAARRDEPTEANKLVANEGLAHEERFLQELKGSGKRVAEIHSKGAQGVEDTLKAIGEAADVIFQANLEMEGFAGYADFLRLGEDKDAGYEVWDTKLARSPKPYFMLQLCCYAEMLQSMTGRLPERIGVVLGNGDERVFRTRDFYAYYLNLKQDFLEFMAGWNRQNRPEPDPRVDHRLWQSHAEAVLQELRSLASVARMSRGQMQILHKQGIDTIDALAEAKARPQGMRADVFERLREQAELQLETERLRKADPQAAPAYRLLAPPAENRELGLGALPPASEGDVFFDLEGYPLGEQSLEYLWGATWREQGAMRFRAWWAHSEEQEDAALIGFLAWVYERLQDWPELHIYHYANYEIAALKRLAVRQPEAEELVDDLLRRRVFVDLYPVVKDGIRLGEPSYSIKYVERLYRSGRATDVATGGESIVYYHRWLESGQGADPESSEILREIRDYNKDDCDSTLELAEWLRERQKELGIAWQAADSEPATMDKVREHIERKDALHKALNKRIEAEPDEAKRRLLSLFRDFVDFHRRDAKPIWWRKFDRLASTDEELMEDIACIAGSDLQSEEPEVEKRSLVFRYSFDPRQDIKVKIGDMVQAAADPRGRFTVVALNTDRGELAVKIGKGSFEKKLEGRIMPSTSWIPDEYVSPGALEKALNGLIEAMAGGAEAPALVRRLLLRESPAALQALQEDAQGLSREEQILKVVDGLDEDCLCIQGPPGTGKTWLASNMIAHLLRQGRRVGISSSSHKAIQNLLRAVAERMPDELKGVYKGPANASPEDDAIDGILMVNDNGKARENYDSGLLAGTPWLFARGEFAGELDYLFIDEAGQVSLANTLAMAQATSNLVLLGDQMQLEQVTQGAHPGHAGDSVLNYCLDGHRVIPRERGIFLPKSYRMHPDLCRIVSNIAYEGQLEAKGTDDFCLQWSSPDYTLPRASGLLFQAVEHEGNVQGSEEEAEAIRKLTGKLLFASFPDGNGGRRPLGIEDILYVTPYNLQVNILKSVLPAQARIASVDKFQGQEAPVVILSMCSSYGEYGSRGIEFILNRNRINVALSRAKALAIVVGDPRIARSPASSIARMMEISTYAELLRSGR